MIEKEKFIEMFVNCLKKNEQCLSDGFHWYSSDQDKPDEDLVQIAEELYDEMDSRIDEELYDEMGS